MQFIEGTGTLIPPPIGLQRALIPSSRIVADIITGYPTVVDFESHTVTYRWNDVELEQGTNYGFWCVYDFVDAELDYNYSNVTIKAYYK